MSGEGITELDAEKTFSVFSKKEGVKYVRNGYLYPDIETAQKQYAEWFEKLQERDGSTYMTQFFLIYWMKIQFC